MTHITAGSLAMKEIHHTSSRRGIHQILSRQPIVKGMGEPDRHLKWDLMIGDGIMG